MERGPAVNRRSRSNNGKSVLCLAGFYHHPQSLEDLVAHVTGKILDRLGVDHAVGARWKGIPEADEDPGTGAALPPDPLGSGSARSQTPGPDARAVDES